MIEGKKVNLRLAREEEIPLFVSLANRMADVGEFWPHWLIKESQQLERFRKDNFWGEDSGKFHIVDKTDTFVGTITFFQSFMFIDGFEIAYRILRPEDRGKGYMSEALNLFVSYMFEIRPINRFLLRIFPENEPSKKLAEKCGFKYEGTLRQAMFHKGKFMDISLFGLIREDWEKLPRF